MQRVWLVGGLAGYLMTSIDYLCYVITDEMWQDIREE
jgi:hypothetical protein